MTAAALARVLGPRLSITLVESSEIGIVGVGEATIPAIAQFNTPGEDRRERFPAADAGHVQARHRVRRLVREGACVHACLRTRRSRPRLHPVSSLLAEGKRAEDRAGSLWDYSFNWLAAKQARFSRVERIPDTPLAGLTWAYHFDASLYAAYLSRLAQGMGVRRVDGKIAGSAARARSRRRPGIAARGRARARGGLLHRLHRFPRAHHRAGAEYRLRRLVDTGCPATARWRFPRRAPARCCHTPAPPRSKPAGNGASRCSIAPAMATCTARRTPATSGRASC